MRSVNKVILIGNLTRDPEMRQTPNGQSVATFGLATNREWVTKDGRKQNSAEYHDLVAWAKLADICNQYLNKGKLIYVEGYLKTRSWDTPEGIKKFRTEIVVQDMIMLDKRGETQSEDYYPENPDEIDSPEKTGETPSKKPNKQQEKASEKITTTPKEEAKEEESEQKEPATVAASQNKLDIDSDLGL